MLFFPTPDRPKIDFKRFLDEPLKLFRTQNVSKQEIENVNWYFIIKSFLLPTNG